MNDPHNPSRRSGLVAIVGRPNVGKSTLLNALVGQKISITSKKAQTTRHRIVGVRTRGDAQFVFVDTPGFQTRHTAALNRTLNRTVLGSVADVDVILYVTEAGRFTLDDASVLGLLPPTRPVVLVANKLDALARRTDVLPWLRQMQERHAFTEYVPMSARRAADVDRLLTIVEPLLPQAPWIYDEDALTDRSERFLAAEIVREKLFRLMGDELPYTSTVVIEKWEEGDGAGGFGATPAGGAATAVPAGDDGGADAGLAVELGAGADADVRADAPAGAVDGPLDASAQGAVATSGRAAAPDVARTRSAATDGLAALRAELGVTEPGDDGAAPALPAGAAAALRGPRRYIAAAIVVDREAHKGMVIGQGGERLKRIGTQARQELQVLLDAPVRLDLWVKVRSGWADDEQHLRSYGYE